MTAPVSLALWRAPVDNDGFKLMPDLSRRIGVGGGALVRWQDAGVDRLAMLKYGMDDLRAFFDGDLRWLKHYGFAALDVPTLSGGVGA